MTQQKKQNFTSNHQDTTTSRATDVIKIIVLIIGGVLIFTSPFWCELFRYQKNEYHSLRDTHNENVRKAENDISYLKTKYDQGDISETEYISSLHGLMDNLVKANDSRANELKESINRTKVLDWNSTYMFLIALGTRIPILVFPLLMLYLFKVNIIRLENSNIKTAFFTFCAASLSTGVFWMVWVLWPFNDFDFNSYIYTIIGFSLLIGAAITQFMLWKKIKMEKLINVIQHLNHVLIISIPRSIKNSKSIDDFTVVYDEIMWDTLEYEADEG